LAGIITIPDDPTMMIIQELKFRAKKYNNINRDFGTGLFNTLSFKLMLLVKEQVFKLIIKPENGQ